MNILERAQNMTIGQVVATNVEGNFNQQIIVQEPYPRPNSLPHFLQPIHDASHTRDRKKSPPDSACYPGTRKGVVKGITSWAMSSLVLRKRHIYWLHGYVGSGKSSVALEVSKVVAQKKRLGGSFFFCRGGGDRCSMTRFAATLASQMSLTIPEAAPFIQTALEAASACTAMSVTEQLHRFVFEPFQAAASRGFPGANLVATPFLIVIDGLDECEDRHDVEAFIDTTIDFFAENPHVPLRFFIASRVEHHIQSHLQAESVVLDDLVGHGSRDDIATFLDSAFAAASQSNPVIQAYIRQNGSWPQKADKERLVNFIGGSFIFASAVFKYIVTPSEDGLTPMQRLALAFNMDPGLDGLYTQTLARAAHLPHFLDVISTIARLRAPLSVSGIADLLGIQTFEVVHVLVDLQAIFQVPGTDNLPVTLCHTSLQDFLKNESRSGRFCAPPSHHLRLAYLCFNMNMKNGQDQPLQHVANDEAQSGQTDAIPYSRHACQVHWYRFWEVCWHNFDLEELARQKVPNGVTYHTFLAFGFFHNVFGFVQSFQDYVPQALGMYMFTEWPKHLARGLDSGESDDHIKKWLETPVDLTIGKWLRDGIEITQDTFKVLERNVCLAFQATKTKFPELLQWRYVHRTSDTFDLNLLGRWSPVAALSRKVFEWIMLRNQHLRERTRQPLRIRVRFGEEELNLGKRSTSVFCNAS